MQHTPSAASQGLMVPLWPRIPKELLAKVDDAAAKLNIKRSAFIREALIDATSAKLALPADHRGYTKDQEVKVCCIRVPVSAAQPITENPDAKRIVSAYVVLAINSKLNRL